MWGIPSCRSQDFVPQYHGTVCQRPSSTITKSYARRAPPPGHKMQIKRTLGAIGTSHGGSNLKKNIHRPYYMRYYKNSKTPIASDNHQPGSFVVVKCTKKGKNENPPLLVVRRFRIHIGPFRVQNAQFVLENPQGVVAIQT